MRTIICMGYFYVYSFYTVIVLNADSVQLFRLNIGVSSLRTSEIEHPITFRVREDRSTANVQPIGSVGLSDAFFGSIPDRDVLFVLGSGIRVIPPLTTFIVDDITVEIDECFTIRMFFTHAPGPREPRVTCNDGDGATSFFCERWKPSSFRNSPTPFSECNDHR